MYTPSRKHQTKKFLLDLKKFLSKSIVRYQCFSPSRTHYFACNVITVHPKDFETNNIRTTTVSFGNCLQCLVRVIKNLNMRITLSIALMEIHISYSRYSCIGHYAPQLVQHGAEDEVTRKIATRFKSTGKSRRKLGEDITEDIENYLDVASGYILHNLRKLQFFHNIFDGDAKRYCRRVVMELPSDSLKPAQEVETGAEHYRPLK